MVFGLAALLAACAGGPPAPDWQVNSAAHLRRYSQAWLKGNTRVAQHEFALARQEAASTGQAVQVARVELTRCALQAAALDFAPCEGFEALRADTPPAETAYAAWLAGQAGVRPPCCPLPTARWPRKALAHRRKQRKRRCRPLKTLCRAWWPLAC